MPDIGHGTTLAYLSGSTYVSVGSITQVSGPALSADSVDTTTMASANSFRTFMKGLKDWGEVTFTTIADPKASGDTTNYYDALLTKAAADASDTWKITFPNSTTATFSGFITGLAPSADVSSLITTSVTIKVSGAVTWA